MILCLHHPYNFSDFLGTDDEYITLTVGQCATEKCILLPVNVSSEDKFTIILDPPTDHDNRIELVDVKQNITILSHNNIGIISECQGLLRNVYTKVLNLVNIV